MPQALVTKIQGDSSKVLHSADIREKLAAQGVEPGGDTPDEVRKVMRADYDRYGTIIRKLNIKAD
jgi:tripartite-type tricarboxylate transporter receptor subunit TctC